MTMQKNIFYFLLKFAFLSKFYIILHLVFNQFFYKAKIYNYEESLQL